MNAMEWSSTRVRVAESTSPASRSTDIPVMKERYDGNSGRTHGERNENSPAENATATPRDSVIACGLLEHRLEEVAGRLAVPLTRAIGEVGAIALAVDDERRGQCPHAIRGRHRHL